MIHMFLTHSGSYTFLFVLTCYCIYIVIYSQMYHESVISWACFDSEMLKLIGPTGKALKISSDQ